MDPEAIEYVFKLMLVATLFVGMVAGSALAGLAMWALS